MQAFKSDFQRAESHFSMWDKALTMLGFQRVDNPLVGSRAESPCRVWDSVPQVAAGRSAKGELKNSPVDCFLRGNALQERAFPYLFPLSFIINCQMQYIYVKGAAFTCKACPSLGNTAQSTSKDLCGALTHTPPETPALDSAKGLANPLETLFY